MNIKKESRFILKYTLIALLYIYKSRILEYNIITQQNNSVLIKILKSTFYLGKTEKCFVGEHSSTISNRFEERVFQAFVGLNSF